MSKPQKNWLEWLVFAVGLVLVAGTLSYLTYTGATMGSQPPDIEVRLGAPEQRQHNFVVPVSVVNHGDKTAGGIRIEVLLKSGGEEKERSELDIPFLPRQATREGWVTFAQDPRAGELKARVLGYEEP